MNRRPGRQVFSGPIGKGRGTYTLKNAGSSDSREAGTKAYRGLAFSTIEFIRVLHYTPQNNNHMTGETVMEYASVRQCMVDNQILPNRVTDSALIDVLSDLPRESFVPKAQLGIAYVDEAIALGEGRYMMEPLALARLLQAAEVKPSDVVLVVGCGSGYETAVLARMASTVVAIESSPELAAKATGTLGELGIDTAAVIEAPLAGGYEKQGPYDVILINGAVAEIPDTLTDQLADGGRMVGIVNGSEASAVLGCGVLVCKVDGQVSQQDVFEAGTPLLPGFEKKQAFVF